MNGPVETVKRKIVLDLIFEGIRAVSPEHIIPAVVSLDQGVLRVNDERYELNGRLFVAGGGKAASTMAGAFEIAVGSDAITAGRVCGFMEQGRPGKIEVLGASHPVPDEHGVNSVRQMLDMRHEYGIEQRDTLVCLISGGGSSMITLPAEGISLDAIRKLTSDLLRSGADIRAINTVRKHLSRVKGGGLAAWFAPARMVALIISDVIGDDPADIASGPTVIGPEDAAGAVEILKKYELWDSLPECITTHLRRIHAKTIRSRPSMSEVYNHVIAGGKTALGAMEAKGTAMGFDTRVLTDAMRGDPWEAARELSRALPEHMEGESRPILFLQSGETTPEIPENHGKGGRNQHFAASFALHMRGYPYKWVLASVGSDGSDYIRDVAGAIVDHTTADRAAQAGIDLRKHLKNYDSFGAFQAIGNSLVRTGPTNTNVGDLVACLVYQ